MSSQPIFWRYRAHRETRDWHMKTGKSSCTRRWWKNSADLQVKTALTRGLSAWREVQVRVRGLPQLCNPAADTDGEEVWTEDGLQEEKILGTDYTLRTCVYDFPCACVQMLAVIHKYKSPRDWNTQMSTMTWSLELDRWKLLLPYHFLRWTRYKTGWAHVVLVSSLHGELQSQQGVAGIHKPVPRMADFDAVRRFFCPSLFG